ncbi:ZNF236 [Cordylochernes scorpioides]|uniref:ZNF236 n=1 Tax=Cordylochernes scorpioides TaxID=51811 RepID=A0ABY6KK75_9ARAC|nr:ZNF236 [Cordylochernes scorpioides]
MEQGGKKEEPKEQDPAWLSNYIAQLQQHFAQLLQALKYTNGPLLPSTIDYLVANFIDAIRKTTFSMKESEKIESLQPSPPQQQQPSTSSSVCFSSTSPAAGGNTFQTFNNKSPACQQQAPPVKPLENCPMTNGSETKQAQDNNSASSILNTLLKHGVATASDIPTSYLNFTAGAAGDFETNGSLFSKPGDPVKQLDNKTVAQNMPLSILNLQREMGGPSRYEAAAMFVGYEVCGTTQNFPAELGAKNEHNSTTNFHTLSAPAKPEQLECALCKQVLRSPAEFASHVAESHRSPATKPGQVYQCPLCSFTTDKSLQCHLQQEHVGDRPFQCELCRKSFFARDKLARHLMIHTQERPFSCSLCDKRFLTKDKLERHVYVHTGFKPFQCELCDKKFSSKYTLNQHLFVHSRNGPLPCHHCDKKFVTKSDQQRHLFAHSTGCLPTAQTTPAQETLLPCHLCGKRFTSRTKLETHVFAHAGGDNAFHCERCPRKFTYRYDLERHLLTHAVDSKPFKCNLCGISFGRKYRLTTHHKSYHSDLAQGAIVPQLS